MDKQTLKAQKRKIFGRKVKRLRADGILPANIYGKKVKSEAIKVSLSDFVKTFEKAGETGLVELVLNGDSKKASKKTVLIHNVQVDPVTDTPIHADFLQVNLKEKVTAAVPIEVIGESPAEKAGKGTVIQQIDEVEIEALPGDLPEKFIVDISSLAEVDQSVVIKDLSFDAKKIEVKEDLEQIVVKVEPVRKEEEEVVAPAEEVEGVETEAEAETEEKPPSGEGKEEKVAAGEKEKAEPQEDGKKTSKE
ncbi:50S ribosomal protein L25 [Patescibacteria group bacterium]|nr:50S ribosomal protein L25 [Patescibacteria group bacterium]